MKLSEVPEFKVQAQQEQQQEQEKSQLEEIKEELVLIRKLLEKIGRKLK